MKNRKITQQKEKIKKQIAALTAFVFFFAQSISISPSQASPSESDILPTMSMDLDRDGGVGWRDLEIMADAFGATDPEHLARVDFDGSGRVDAFDIDLMRTVFSHHEDDFDLTGRDGRTTRDDLDILRAAMDRHISESGYQAHLDYFPDGRIDFKDYLTLIDQLDTGEFSESRDPEQASRSPILRNQLLNRRLNKDAGGVLYPEEGDHFLQYAWHRGGDYFGGLDGSFDDLAAYAADLPHVNVEYVHESFLTQPQNERSWSYEVLENNRFVRDRWFAAVSGKSGGLANPAYAKNRLPSGGSGYLINIGSSVRNRNGERIGDWAAGELLRESVYRAERSGTTLSLGYDTVGLAAVSVLEAAGEWKGSVYENPEAYRRALRTFLTSMRKKLRGAWKDLYIETEFPFWQAGHDEIWQDFLDNVDGVMDTAAFGRKENGTFEAVYGSEGWERFMEYYRSVMKRGKVLLLSAETSDWDAAEDPEEIYREFLYTLCSYLLIKKPGYTFYGIDFGSEKAYASPSWARDLEVDLGRARGEAVPSENMFWHRSYDYGIVFVNPYGEERVVRLDALGYTNPFYDKLGNRVYEIVLPAQSGYMVFTYANPAPSPDFNKDGSVGYQDLDLLHHAWNSHAQDAHFDESLDLNEDLVINEGDLNKLLAGGFVPDPDTNRDGRVDERDKELLKAHRGTSIEAGAYQAAFDLNASGEIDERDEMLVKVPSEVSPAMDDLVLRNGLEKDPGNGYDAAAIVDPDTDGDGLPDGWEIAYGLNPNDSDSDDDGILDGQEDPDGDGLTNAEEYGAGANPLSVGSDSDALPDAWEVQFGLDPSQSDSDGDGMDDGNDDLDGDGVSNYLEEQLSANPTLVDTDADGLTDPEEIFTYHSRPDWADTDYDGLSDAAELSASPPINPRNADSDGDGVSDQNDSLPLAAEDGLNFTYNGITRTQRGIHVEEEGFGTLDTMPWVELINPGVNPTERKISQMEIVKSGIKAWASAGATQVGIVGTAKFDGNNTPCMSDAGGWLDDESPAGGYQNSCVDTLISIAEEWNIPIIFGIKLYDPVFTGADLFNSASLGKFQQAGSLIYNLFNQMGGSDFIVPYQSIVEGESIFVEAEDLYDPPPVDSNPATWSGTSAEITAFKNNIAALWPSGFKVHFWKPNFFAQCADDIGFPPEIIPGSSCSNRKKADSYMFKWIKEALGISFSPIGRTFDGAPGGSTAIDTYYYLSGVPGLGGRTMPIDWRYLEAVRRVDVTSWHHSTMLKPFVSLELPSKYERGPAELVMELKDMFGAGHNFPSIPLRKTAFYPGLGHFEFAGQAVANYVHRGIHVQVVPNRIIQEGERVSVIVSAGPETSVNISYDVGIYVDCEPGRAGCREGISAGPDNYTLNVTDGSKKAVFTWTPAYHRGKKDKRYYWLLFTAQDSSGYFARQVIRLRVDNFGIGWSENPHADFDADGYSNADDPDPLTPNAGYLASDPDHDYFVAGDTLNELMDSDGDGMPNYWENAYGLNPNSPADAQGDLDNDLFKNVNEYQAGTDPASINTDGDGLSDFGDPQPDIFNPSPIADLSNTLTEIIDADGNGMASVTVDGSRSFHPDLNHQIVGHLWWIDGVPRADLVNQSVVSVNLEEGEHTIRLWLLDDAGFSSVPADDPADEITVTVLTTRMIAVPPRSLIRPL